MWYQESPRDRLIRAAKTAEFKTKFAARHKCFLSYAAADIDEVAGFVDDFGAAFIPRVIGVSEDDPFVNSDDDDYVMEQIRERYLWDSTVTIVLVGRCTWARRFVDWEIYSSLRDGRVNRTNGLMAIQLPSIDGTSTSIPERLYDNVPTDRHDRYARYYRYPPSESVLRTNIDDAFLARSSRVDLIENSKPRKRVNLSCS